MAPRSSDNLDEKLGRRRREGRESENGLERIEYLMSNASIGMQVNDSLRSVRMTQHGPTCRLCVGEQTTLVQRV